ncbi:hypothetical protein GCM10010271_05010 [Streptomyces kurssanovii]|nr:hypothetical protein GCM10010271_05010 [Streptomyces kurssanovii]
MATMAGMSSATADLIMISVMRRMLSARAFATGRGGEQVGRGTGRREWGG